MILEFFLVQSSPFFPTALLFFSFFNVFEKRLLTLDLRNSYLVMNGNKGITHERLKDFWMPPKRCGRKLTRLYYEKNIRSCKIQARDIAKSQSYPIESNCTKKKPRHLYLKINCENRFQKEPTTFLFCLFVFKLILLLDLFLTQLFNW